MKVLVIGRTGQVATELLRLCDARYCHSGCLRAGFQEARIIVLGRPEIDLTDPEGCAQAVSDADADVVINAAAYTAVDKAEEEEGLARVVNAEAPAAMARAATEREIPFLQVSTDYVYDGSGDSLWQPDSATGPLGAYGRTKLAGDVGVIAAGGPYAVLRTSWVFSAHGGNFVKTMLRLGRERDHLNVVSDQIGGPTPAAAIADALWSMVESFHTGQGQSGIHHLSGAPDVSWAGFAREIFRQTGIDCVVNDIPTTNYPTPARRPLNSRLDCSGLLETFGVPRPDWRQGLAHVLKELGEIA